MSHVLALDAHSLIHRSYHAAAYSAQDKEAEINIAPVLIGFLNRIISANRPDYVVAAADHKGGSFRKQLDPNYKASRKPTPEGLKQQIGVGIKTMANFGIPVHQAEGFEGDDVLATLSTKIKPGHKLTLVSSDRDLAALITPQVQLYLLRTGQHVLYTHNNAREMFGVEPDRICQYKALVGDSSDNISGVPGVGPKGALKLLEACADLDEIVARAEEFGRCGKLVREHEAAMRLSYQLADMRYDAPCQLDAAEALWTPDKAQKLAGR